MRDDASASIGGLAKVWDLDLPPIEKLVLLYVANQGGGSRVIDIVNMARFAGVAVHEIQPHINRLVKRGMLVTRNEGGTLRMMKV